jgi:hypothetical protein
MKNIKEDIKLETQKIIISLEKVNKLEKKNKLQ